MLHWQKTTQHRFILIFRIEYLASRTDHRHTPDTGNIQAGSGLPAVRLLNRRIPPIGGRHHIRSKFRWGSRFPYAKCPGAFQPATGWVSATKESLGPFDVIVLTEALTFRRGAWRLCYVTFNAALENLDTEYKRIARCLSRFHESKEEFSPFTIKDGKRAKVVIRPPTFSEFFSVPSLRNAWLFTYCSLPFLQSPYMYIHRQNGAGIYAAVWEWILAGFPQPSEWLSYAHRFLPMFP